MIVEYNRRQNLKAMAQVVLGLICCALCYLFFLGVPEFVASQFKFGLSDLACHGIALLGLAASALSAHRAWRQGGGLHSYHESGLYHDFDESNGGAWVVNRELHRVTAWAYILGQIFMSGPLLLLRARTTLAGRIPESHELEASLEAVLDHLRAINKWQGLGELP
ncbi:MAG TPA: hypothetical protein VFY13_08340, partial [Luteolibacter sp.]|nr:hypothetical protein [Luteolibacter sp.]